MGKKYDHHSHQNNTGKANGDDADDPMDGDDSTSKQGVESRRGRPHKTTKTQHQETPGFLYIICLGISWHILVLGKVGVFPEMDSPIVLCSGLRIQGVDDALGSIMLADE